MPVYSYILPQYASLVRLTFSLMDGGGWVGRAWVCAAFDTEQTPATTSGTGLRELSINAPSFLGRVFAAVSTVWTKRDSRREFGGVDVPSANLKAFNRTCYIMAVKQRLSGGGNIWQIKNVCVCHLL